MRVVVACLLVAAAAGVMSSGSGVAARPASTTDTSRASGPAIVGRWSRVTTCQELVSALRKAGLGATAPAMLEGNGLVLGTKEQITHKADICSGARPRAHSHFFTAQGAFGSLDWKGEQVDDGNYRVVDAHTLRIGDAAFRYRVNGKQLTLTPVITAAAKRKALANPLNFSTAGWQVAVSFPGHTWKRVPCSGWC